MSASSFALPTNPADDPTNSSDGSAFLNPPGQSTIWSGAGGPALVVVFIAVGLFAALLAIMLMVRYRRIRIDDDDDDDEEHGYGPLTVNRLRKRPKLGPKPKIFELPIAYGQGGSKKEDVVKWTGIVVSCHLSHSVDWYVMSGFHQPISAAFLADESDKPSWLKELERASSYSSTSSNASQLCTTPPQGSPPPYVYPSPDPAAPGTFSWRYLRPSPIIQDPHAPLVSEPELTPVPDRMQIAVTIAMPRPPAPSIRRPPPGLGMRSEPAVNPVPVPELCLGFAQVQGTSGGEWRELHAAAAQAEKEE